MSRHHQAGECLGPANRGYAACSCYRPRTGTRRIGSLRGGSEDGQHLEKWLALWFGSNLQRPHLPKHSNKPKLQLRFPSGPVGQFLVFLLPPTCIGAMPCKNTKRDMRNSTIESPQSIGELGKDTHLRLGVDWLFDIGHGHTWNSQAISRPFMCNQSLWNLSKSLNSPPRGSVSAHVRTVHIRFL